MVLKLQDLLVVDDDEMACEIAAASLKSMGLCAEWTLNTDQAMEMAGKRHQEGRDYSIILLDYSMPEKDGIRTAERLRKIVGDAPRILLLYDGDWGEAEERARGAGIMS